MAPGFYVLANDVLCQGSICCSLKILEAKVPSVYYYIYQDWISFEMTKVPRVLRVMADISGF